MPGEIVSLAPVVTPQGDVVIPVPVVTSKVYARRAADKIIQKYKNIRKNKALKLLKLRGSEQALMTIQIKKKLYLQKVRV